MGILEPIRDILTKLTTLQVPDGDGGTKNIYARIWNNQIRKKTEGKSYVYPTPAVFLEVVSPATYQTVGERIKVGDIAFRLHIEHTFYNGDGTFEQDLRIFDLRDQISVLLHGFKPSGCGPLEPLTEEQDYDHTETNVYIIDFIAAFADTVAQKQYTMHSAASELDVALTEVGTDVLLKTPVPAQQHFTIPKRNL